jgi:hypothetical protein
MHWTNARGDNKGAKIVAHPRSRHLAAVTLICLFAPSLALAEGELTPDKKAGNEAALSHGGKAHPKPKGSAWTVQRDGQQEPPRPAPAPRLRDLALAWLTGQLPSPPSSPDLPSPSPDLNKLRRTVAKRVRESGAEETIVGTARVYPTMGWRSARIKKTVVGAQGKSVRYSDRGGLVKNTRGPLARGSGR